MNREGSTVRIRAGTALAAAFVLLGGLSTAALANGDHRGKLDTRSGMTPDLNDPKISGDTDYGVCRGTDPRCYHNWVDDRQNRVLVYSRTAGPRHANLGPALPSGKFTPENGYGGGAVTAAHTVQMALVRWLG